jgi:biotin transport system substrate-specific component
MAKGNESRLNLRMTVYCALFTALIIIGGYMSVPIPVGPVPIVLADLFVMAAGIFLGPKFGMASAALYLGLGAVGLPVFAGGTSGLAVLFGPTGGFLFGYILAAGAAGLVAGRMKPGVPAWLAAMIAANIALYAVGVPWLKFLLNMSWPAALAVGLTPFIAGVLIKIAAAVALCRALLPRFKQAMAPSALAQADGEGN